MEPYKTLDPGAGRRLPETERLARCVLVLPTGPTVDAAAIDTICRVIRLSVKHGAELKRRLRLQP
jgi:dTDP-4-amino-4,6-dideoxyglucose